MIRHLNPLAALFTALLCAVPALATEQPFMITGRMQHTDLEGGCWYLEADDGERYQITGSEEQLGQIHHPGKQVRLRVIRTGGMASICMTGPILKIVEIDLTHGYPIDLPTATKRVNGRIYQNKQGCLYLKLHSGTYELSQEGLPAMYKRPGARFVNLARVVRSKGTSACGFSGVLYFVAEKSNDANFRRELPRDDPR